MEAISESRCFGGVQGVYKHASDACGCDMTFGLFLPAEAEDGPVPVLWYLSGLMCTHAEAMEKTGAQQWAAEQGIALVFPDTSPRGEGVADDPAYNLGSGAGFYVNATQAPWAQNYQMWDYVAEELPRLLVNNAAIDENRQAIMGHSMGGHGALTIAMAYPGRFTSVSALAPVSHPSTSDWAKKPIHAYLGEGNVDWTRHDACLSLRANGFNGPMLIDQGTADPFIDALMPEALAAAIIETRHQGTVRMQPGYDHSYFFISTFMEDHVAFHAEALYA
ncbi:S-formylglutathione hydrolase [Rhodovulum adriaticum]|uniref:S-formylglutathione hydrolase n=1 Tax=Rhodovulum adriaticum TaxID=35804 RepID=A0A4R2NI28_RHOAD|nr:S-formylglutathione hydrolase [Rhodovulum adriaticum]MBK1637258.1 S-formylglutathione hydrolase [Rhodovulum adriaticum]TCP20928.1 S-formylglutathione hydrolase [Rhodovulum adriaticum]